MLFTGVENLRNEITLGSVPVLRILGDDLDRNHVWIVPALGIEHVGVPPLLIAKKSGSPNKQQNACQQPRIVLPVYWSHRHRPGIHLRLTADPSMPVALLVDNDSDTLASLASVFREHGYEPEIAQSLERAREVFLDRLPEVAMLAERVGDENSLDLLEELDLAPVIEIFLMSSERSIGSATRAMRAGVTDYFDKPVDTARLAANIEALERDREQPGDDTAVSKDARGLLVGESKPMRRVYRLVRKCAPTDAYVLVSGESGTGKELVAQTLHELSDRRSEPFVPVNCSAVPADLIESELFGHRKGSFTGATRDHAGLFEQATGGTLFLDEITEMSPDLQAKLLRVLETGTVRPIGGKEDISVDARVIAATNKDPQESVESGVLREDLYYRLAQFPMHLPPLRERGDDIVLLARHFLDEHNEASGVAKTLSQETIDALTQHDWPGNVRELRNAVLHGHLLAGGEIEPDDLPDGIPSSATGGGPFLRIGIGAPLDEVQRRYTLSTLAHFDGNKKRTAEVLGISLKTLYNRLRTYRAD
jgi:two-component system response regulator AtoC